MTLSENLCRVTRSAAPLQPAKMEPAIVMSFLAMLLLRSLFPCIAWILRPTNLFHLNLIIPYSDRPISRSLRSDKIYGSSKHRNANLVDGCVQNSRLVVAKLNLRFQLDFGKGSVRFARSPDCRELAFATQSWITTLIAPPNSPSFPPSILPPVISREPFGSP